MQFWELFLWQFQQALLQNRVKYVGIVVHLHFGACKMKFGKLLGFDNFQSLKYRHLKFKSIKKYPMKLLVFTHLFPIQRFGYYWTYHLYILFRDGIIFWLHFFSTIHCEPFWLLKHPFLNDSKTCQICSSTRKNYSIYHKNV